MSRRIVLSERYIANVNPAAPGKRNCHWDALVPSFGLRVSDKGHRSWIMQRRVNGRLILVTLGEYPALKLSIAREKARGVLEDMARGRSPEQTENVKAGLLRSDSFEGAVETYIQRDVERNRRPRTQLEINRTLRKVFVPRWGTLALSEIGPREVIAVLDIISDAGTPVAANRARSVLHRFFRWAMERQLTSLNPVAAVRKPNKETPRERALSDEELRDVWIQSGHLGWPFGPFIRTLILTGQRRNEVAGMRWSEISAKERLWIIPGWRTKNGREHSVPISSALQAILDAVPRYLSEDSDGLVFTSNQRTPVSGFSDAKEKLDARVLRMRGEALAAGVRDARKVRPLPHWTLHDLRRSCATGMGRIGIQPHIIEAALNHSGGYRAGVAGVYQRQTYLPERRAAFDRWGNHLESLSLPADTNIFEFSG